MDKDSIKKEHLQRLYIAWKPMLEREYKDLNIDNLIEMIKTDYANYIEVNTPKKQVF